MIDGGVNGVSLGQEFLAVKPWVMPGDAVVEPAAHFFQPSNGCFDVQHIIVESRCLEATETFGDRQDNAPFFNVPVAADPFPHQLCPAHLEVAQIIGIIDNTCGIGISVENPARGYVNRGRHLASVSLEEFTDQGVAIFQ